MTIKPRLTAQQRAYRRFLRTPEWLVQRARVIVRSGGLCEICHKRKLRQVHHRFYSDPIAATPDSDLIGLCGFCHRREHIRPAGYAKESISLGFQEARKKVHDTEQTLF